MDVKVKQGFLQGTGHRKVRQPLRGGRGREEVLWLVVFWTILLLTKVWGHETHIACLHTIHIITTTQHSH